MKEVNIWALKRAASDGLKARLDWHISGPSTLSINELMDEPSGGVYHRLGIFVIVERIGRIVINEQALAKINLDETDIMKMGLRKKFFRWPLR